MLKLTVIRLSQDDHKLTLTVIKLSQDQGVQITKNVIFPLKLTLIRLSQDQRVQT